MARIRLLGAAGGAVFAILTLIAFLIAPGPSSANGVTVVEYYTTHGDAAVWQAVLAGFGIVCFLWFAGTFAATMPSANAVLVSAGVMAAIYLVTLGAWEALAETYKDVDIVDVPSEGYGDAHVLYDVGVGAAHLASFANAAFVGATAVALLSGAVVRWRRLGWVGVGLTVVWLINALALMAVAYLMPSIQVSSFGAALVAALVLGLVNAIVRPVLVLLTLPVTILTLGLFIFVLNGLLFWMVGSWLQGFWVAGFWAGVLGAIVFSIISWALSALVLR